MTAEVHAVSVAGGHEPAGQFKRLGTPVARPVTTQSRLNSITITHPAGQHFYRLKST